MSSQQENIPRPMPLIPEKGKNTRRHQGIPSIEILPSGRLFASYYAASFPGEGAGNYALLATSAPGEPWHEIQMICPVLPAGRIFDPVLWLDPLGRLWWIFNHSLTDQSPQNPPGKHFIHKIYDGQGGVCACICPFPDSPHPVWQPPIKIGDGIMATKPTVLQDGGWAFPCAMWNHDPDLIPPHLKKIAFSNLRISRDQGKTFSLVIGPDVPGRYFDEHILVERKTEWWCCVRTTYGIGESISRNQGRTWSTGKDSGLGGVCSRFALRRLRSGRLLLINHRRPMTLPGEQISFKDRLDLRSHLCAWLSDDDGQTWYGNLCLDPRSMISYPDFCEGNDGFIYCIYDRQRKILGQILLARFTESDVAAGELLTPGAFEGQLVSSFDKIRNPDSI